MLMKGITYNPMQIVASTDYGSNDGVGYSLWIPIPQIMINQDDFNEQNIYPDDLIGDRNSEEDFARGRMATLGEKLAMLTFVLDSTPTAGTGLIQFTNAPLKEIIAENETAGSGNFISPITWTPGSTANAVATETVNPWTAFRVVSTLNTVDVTIIGF